MRVTKDNITELKENEIFVFGSNTKGIHGAGAAKLAKDKFGAIMGIGFGLVGNSYALPTKDDNIKTLPLNDIKQHVKFFIEYTKEKPKLTFLVTEIGCGLAGYKPSDIAPFFKDAIEVENIHLPQRFIDVIIYEMN